jgi:hypothetical protein
MAQALMIFESPKAQVNVAMPCNGYSVRPVRELQASEGIEQIQIPQDKARKYMINGQIYIALPDGKIFDLRGLRVR